MAKAKPTWVGLWRPWGHCAELLRIHKHQACLQAADRSAPAVPASHVTGLIAIIAIIAAMLHVGGAIGVVPAFKAERFIDLLATERITHTLMVPAVYNLCLMQPGFALAAAA